MSNPYQNPYVDIHLTRTRATATTRAAITREATTKEGTITGDTEAGEGLPTEGEEGTTTTHTSQAIKATEMGQTRAIDRTITMMRLIAVPVSVQPVAPAAYWPSAATDVRGPVLQPSIILRLINHLWAAVLRSVK